MWQQCYGYTTRCTIPLNCWHKFCFIRSFSRYTRTDVLGVPMAYLVAEDEETAEAIHCLGNMSARERAQAMELLRKLKK